MKSNKSIQIIIKVCKTVTTCWYTFKWR